MIKQQTVLILGAGASADYGFPLASKLKSSIDSRLQFARRAKPSTVGEKSEAARMYGHYEQLEIEKDLLRLFAEKLYESDAHSVDEFLEANTSSSGLVLAGKTIIAESLLPYEQKAMLYSPKGWYRHLRSAMISVVDPTTFHSLSPDDRYRYLTKGFLAIRSNKLSIVTFNYDRSLEAYLRFTLEQMYNRVGTEEVTNLLVSSIPIIHIHGSLGGTPWGGGRPYRFDSAKLDKDIRDARSRVKIVHDPSTTEDDVDKAQRACSSAERIIFLGFSFHPLNIVKLDPQSWRNPKVFSSNFDFTEMEQRSIQRKLGHDITFARRGSSILNSLREIVDLEDSQGSTINANRKTTYPKDMTYFSRIVSCLKTQYQRWKKSKITDQLMVIITSLIGVAAIVGLSFNFIQLNAFNKAVAIENRAYLTVSASYDSGGVLVGQLPLSIDLKISNIGRTPAYKVKHKQYWDFEGAARRRCDTLIETPIDTGYVIGAGSSISKFLMYNRESLSGPQPGGPPHGGMVVLFGIVVYEDIFHQPHYTSFTFEYNPPNILVPTQYCTDAR